MHFLSLFAQASKEKDISQKVIFRRVFFRSQYYFCSSELSDTKIGNHYSSNISTTPITAIGCWQCLPHSVVQLKGKHCRKSHCCNGVVDTFGQCIGVLNVNFNSCISIVNKSFHQTLTTIIDQVNQAHLQKRRTSSQDGGAVAFLLYQNQKSATRARQRNSVRYMLESFQKQIKYENQIKSSHCILKYAS